MSSSPGPRSRFETEAGGRVVLLPRDEQIIEEVYLHQAMSREQIQALHFGSVARCNGRLRQLFDAGYLRRHFLPWAPFGSQAIYCPGSAAAPLIAARLELEICEVRRHCRSHTPQFLRHTLEVVNFYLMLQTYAGLCADVELECWLPEILVRHEYEVRAPGGSGWKKEVFKPDAFFRLETAAGYRSYFLEVDLGNTSSGQWRSKIARYRRYLQSGLFAERYGCGEFRALVVTTSDTRVKHLQALLSGANTDRFWFTTFSLLNERGPLGPVWQPSAGAAQGLL